MQLVFSPLHQKLLTTRSGTVTWLIFNCKQAIKEVIEIEFWLTCHRVFYRWIIPTLPLQSCKHPYGMHRCLFVQTLDHGNLAFGDDLKTENRQQQLCYPRYVFTNVSTTGDRTTWATISGDINEPTPQSDTRAECFSSRRILEDLKFWCITGGSQASCRNLQ